MRDPIKGLSTNIQYKTKLITLYVFAKLSFVSKFDCGLVNNNKNWGTKKRYYIVKILLQKIENLVKIRSWQSVKYEGVKLSLWEVGGKILKRTKKLHLYCLLSEKLIIFWTWSLSILLKLLYAFLPRLRHFSEFCQHFLLNLLKFLFFSK